MKHILLLEALQKNHVLSWPDLVSGLGFLWSDTGGWIPVNTRSFVVKGSHCKFKDRNGRVWEFNS